MIKLEQHPFQNSERPPILDDELRISEGHEQEVCYIPDQNCWAFSTRYTIPRSSSIVMPATEIWSLRAIMKQKAQYSWNGMKGRMCGYVAVEAQNPNPTPHVRRGLLSYAEFDLAACLAASSELDTHILPPMKFPSTLELEL